jgi:hypothetical protein
MERVLTHA